MFDWLITLVGVLDSLPDAGRAMLSGAVLAGGLCYVERRLPANLVGLAIAYRKAVLVALVCVPLLVYYALGLRFVMVVEELPEIAAAPSFLWWSLFGVWGIGLLARGAGDIAKLIRSARRITRYPSADGKLIGRLEFWQQRIGITKRVALCLGNSEQPWTHGSLKPMIGLPRSAAHWPAPVQDAILVHELCHIKHRHWAWLVASRLVAAVYWPITWVSGLTEHLNLDFQESSDARAIEFFGDRMGYSRALKHIAQRIDPLPHEQASTSPAENSPLLAWHDSESLESREAAVRSSVSRDPCYDRVFWGLTQATLAMFLLTGTTLEQLYIPEDAQFVPEEFWYVSFGASSRYEDVKDWSSMAPADRGPTVLAVPTTVPTREEP
jgi:hypothetical protein